VRKGEEIREASARIATVRSRVVRRSPLALAVRRRFVIPIYRRTSDRRATGMQSARKIFLVVPG
jgi:hypothetical protein